jgi:hypothetical protein
VSFLVTQAGFSAVRAGIAATLKVCYVGATMIIRTQIPMEKELQRRARRRASEIGVSLAEYVRRLVARDLDQSEPRPDPNCIFDLGNSDGSDVALEKNVMIAEAFDTARR